MLLRYFFSLEWKAFFRSSNFNKNIFIKILMGLFALYFSAVFLVLGFGLYFILKRKIPGQDPFTIVNNYLFFLFLGDIMLRFFLQKLPVMVVKPLLVLPIKKHKIVNYVLKKSVFSFFNLLPLFVIIPFGSVLIGNNYPPLQVMFWMLALVLAVLIVNFLNFIVESFSGKSEFSFLSILVVGLVLFALNHFNVIAFQPIVAKLFVAIYENPYFIGVPLAILVVCYGLNYKLLRQKLFLDNELKDKQKDINISDLGWTKVFGNKALFVQLDLKLIWRNKRTKSSIWIVLMGLFYGLFFYPQSAYKDVNFFYAFVGIFSTGIFLINFGQFVPAWDSGYYKLLMSQNFKYKHYIASKFTLMALSVGLLFVLGLPYMYFGWKVILVHFVAAIYNIGVNTHVILWGGAYNRKKINLNEKAAFNYQGTGAVQWLIGIPLLLLPMLIFGGLDYFVNFEVACLALGVLGVLGIILHQKIMRFIESKYMQSKYKMIAAFDQEN